MDPIRRSLTFSIAALTLVLMVWSIAETFKNGFTFWTSVVLVYLAFTGMALWLFLRSEAKTLSNTASATPNDPLEQTSSLNGQLEVSERKAEEIVLQVIQKNGKVQRHDLLPKVRLSRSSLGRLLDQMETKGLISQVGERKATHYVLPEKEG